MNEEAVIQIIEKVEDATRRDDARAVALALTIVAAKRARAAGASKEEFSETCGSAWGMSTE